MKKLYSFITADCETDSRMFIIYILNLTDYLFTLVLISSGLFFEANPLLSYGINGTAGFLAKCMLPLMLMLFIRLRIFNDPPERMIAVKLLLDVILAYYIVINSFHIFWFSYSSVIFL